MTKVATDIRDNSDVKIVDASQYLGADTAIDLRETLDTLVNQDVLKIVVNLSAVEHINSRSIGALIATAKKLHAVNGVLKVYGLADVQNLPNSHHKILKPRRTASSIRVQNTMRLVDHSFLNKSEFTLISMLIMNFDLNKCMGLELNELQIACYLNQLMIFPESR